MIQKCPHCRSDVIFSRNICPACGYQAHDGERLDSDYIGDQAKLGIVPAYTKALEETLNETQKRGRLLTALVIGMLLAPLVVLNVVALVWLSPSWPGILALGLAGWLSRRFWFGADWSRLALGVLAGIAGASGLVVLVLGFGGLNPVARLACGVFGLVYVWSAAQLLRSADIPEFQRIQRIMGTE